MLLAREQQRSLDITTLFGWFILYSGIGWLYETTYCYLTTGKMYNRGFLYGPVIPIYGLSILLMIMIFSDRCKSIFSLFASCSLVATLLEYVTSVWMEFVFHRRWWNYSDMIFNIEGRVCLGASLLFGCCGVLFVRYIHPAMVRLIDSNFSGLRIRKATRIVLLIFVLDVLYSFRMRLL